MTHGEVSTEVRSFPVTPQTAGLQLLDDPSFVWSVSFFEIQVLLHIPKQANFKFTFTCIHNICTLLPPPAHPALLFGVERQVKMNHAY